MRIDASAGAAVDECRSSVQSAVEDTVAIWDILRRNGCGSIIQNNADLPAHRTFGNHEASVPWGRVARLRRYNADLTDAATRGAGVSIFDLDFLSSEHGKSRWHDARAWHYAKQPFDMNAIGLVAFAGARQVAAIRGRSRKCLVLDLDNTLWGGAVADDGIEGIRLGAGPEGEAFVAFQEYVQALGRRGIILCVCSKNDDRIARLPFLKHPDMRLRLDDVAVFQANWNDKASNLREIAAQLEIGLDAIVFADDNPAECDLVRRMLPQVAVLNLPDDPAEYVRALDAGAFFETVKYTQEDGLRTADYRATAARTSLKTSCADLTTYLRELDMRAMVGRFDDLHLPRIAQLINKSNQFHLTTTRYDESTLRRMAARADIHTRWFRLVDRFSDNGLVSAIIARHDRSSNALSMDTWVMSCRVLARGLEEFVANELVGLAQLIGAASLIGEYRPTARNGLVAGLYARLGFEPIEERLDGATLWRMALDPPPAPLDTCIGRAAGDAAGSLLDADNRRRHGPSAEPCLSGRI